MPRSLKQHIRSNIVGYLALVVALGGTGAYAADRITSGEIVRNAVRSKHIKNGNVRRPDLARNAVNSGKVADGSLLNQDFAPGQLPAGAPGAPGAQGERGPQGVPGSARAYGFVSATGELSRNKGVVAVTRRQLGVYCIDLDPSIDPETAAIITSASTSPNEGAAMTYDVVVFGNTAPCIAGVGGVNPTDFAVKAFVYDGDEADNAAGGDTISAADVSFSFVVP